MSENKTSVATTQVEQNSVPAPVPKQSSNTKAAKPKSPKSTSKKSTATTKVTEPIDPNLAALLNDLDTASKIDRNDSDLKPLDLFNWVLDRFPNLQYLNVYVSKPDVVDVFDRYHLNIVLMQVLNKDKSKQFIHYEEFSNDVKCLIIHKETVNKTGFDKFMVVIEPKVLPYMEGYYRKAKIATNDVSALVEKYIEMKGIKFEVEDEDTTHVAEAIVDDLAALISH
jgi:hypothetical protein